MTKLSSLSVIVSMITVLASCSRDEARTIPQAAETTHDAGAEQVMLRGRAVDEDGESLATRELLLEPFRSCRNGDSYSSRSTSHETRTDSEGRFTFQIAKRVEDNCTRSVLVRPASRDVPDLPTNLQPSFRIALPVLIETTDFDAGVVRLIAPARRFRPLSDDELERAALGAQTKTLSTPQHELESVLSELVRRGGERFEAFLEAQWKAHRENPPQLSFTDKGFYYLTALRRLQHRPDPLAVRIVGGASRLAHLPLGPVFDVELVNVDDAGTNLRVVERPCEGCANWNVEVRTLDGERMPMRVWPWLGSTGYDLRRTLAPGEAQADRVVLAKYAAFVGAGTYEARLHYVEQDKIAQEEDVTDRIVSSSAWTRFEIQPALVRSTPADQERALAAITAVDDSTPVRVMYETWDPLQPFTAEPRSSDEVLWALGLASVKPLADALTDTHLSLQKRAWILAQLYNLTGLHAPFAERGTLGPFAFVDVRFSKEEEGFVVEPGIWKIDEAKQLAPAERWKKSVQSFVLEITPNAQSK